MLSKIFRKNRQGLRRVNDSALYILSLIGIIIGLLSLVILLSDSMIDGLPWLSFQFLTSFPSRFPEQAGLLAALSGSIWVIGLTALLSFPLGIGAALYLEEYAPQNWLTSFIQLNISNLAGVPSIVYGILGLGLFVRAL